MEVDPRLVRLNKRLVALLDKPRFHGDMRLEIAGSPPRVRKVVISESLDMGHFSPIYDTQTND